MSSYFQHPIFVRSILKGTFPRYYCFFSPNYIICNIFHNIIVDNVSNEMFKLLKNCPGSKLRLLDLDAHFRGGMNLG